MKNNIILRTASIDDIPAIGKLYSETVRNVNSKDYSPEQIKVWSSAGDDYDMWKQRLSSQYFVIAEIQGVLAGFCSVTPTGYLDFLYVSKDHQRMGAAKNLLREIEHKAHEQKNNLIYSHVSKTAKGFFEKFGYKHERDIEDNYKGVMFINALMVKQL